MRDERGKEWKNKERERYDGTYGRMDDRMYGRDKKLREGTWETNKKESE